MAKIEYTLASATDTEPAQTLTIETKGVLAYAAIPQYRAHLVEADRWFREKHGINPALLEPADVLNSEYAGDYWIYKAGADRAIILSGIVPNKDIPASWLTVEGFATEFPPALIFELNYLITVENPGLFSASGSVDAQKKGHIRRIT